MSTQFNYTGMLAGMVVGAVVGFAGFIVVQERQEYKIEEAKEASRGYIDNQTQISWDNERAQDEIERRISYSKSWAENLEDKPKTTKRDNFAIALYEATKDGEFSESEHSALTTQYRNLESYNTNEHTKEEARKILEGAAL